MILLHGSLVFAITIMLLLVSISTVVGNTDIKNESKIYHFYLDIKPGFECGEFKCGSIDVTKQVIDLLSE